MQPDADQTTTVDLGPAHPATRGTLRLRIELSGDRILRATPQIGWLHRGFEKTCEELRWPGVIPYTDRLNYASALPNNFAYAMAVEALLGCQLPERAQYLRVIGAELARMLDHVVCLGGLSLTIGADTVFQWLLAAREHLLDPLAALTGARVTCSWGRIGGVASDLPDGWPARMTRALDAALPLIDKTDRLLSGSALVHDRLAGVGTLPAAEALAWGITGPLLRACGVALDLRKSEPYWVYDRLTFDVPVGRRGDCLDRYLVRLMELRQSAHILRQALAALPGGPCCAEHPELRRPTPAQVSGTVQGAIRHTQAVLDSPLVPAGEAYGRVESPNGELGFLVVSDGTARPARVHCRPPCLYAVQALSQILPDHELTDVAPIIASINLVGGECDR